MARRQADSLGPLVVLAHNLSIRNGRPFKVDAATPINILFSWCDGAPPDSSSGLASPVQNLQPVALRQLPSVSGSFIRWALAAYTRVGADLLSQQLVNDDGRRPSRRQRGGQLVGPAEIGLSSPLIAAQDEREGQRLTGRNSRRPPEH